jgi:putative ABC transport system ATP-binding protein
LPEIRKKSIGFVFQQFNLFPSLTALENVEYALNVKGHRNSAARKEADRVLDAVGLSDRKDFLPRDLSGGQKQRIAIARALAGRSPILLADEPTANLDSKTAEALIELMANLNRDQQVTFVFSSHDSKVIDRARRVVFLEDGRVRSERRAA